MSWSAPDPAWRHEQQQHRQGQDQRSHHHTSQHQESWHAQSYSDVPMADQYAYSAVDGDDQQDASIEDLLGLLGEVSNTTTTDVDQQYHATLSSVVDVAAGSGPSVEPGSFAAYLASKQAPVRVVPDLSTMLGGLSSLVSLLQSPAPDRASSSNDHQRHVPPASTLLSSFHSYPVASNSIHDQPASADYQQYYEYPNNSRTDARSEYVGDKLQRQLQQRFYPDAVYPDETGDSVRENYHSTSRDDPARRSRPSHQYGDHNPPQYHFTVPAEGGFKRQRGNTAQDTSAYSQRIDRQAYESSSWPRSVSTAFSSSSNSSYVSSPSRFGGGGSTTRVPHTTTNFRDDERHGYHRRRSLHSPSDTSRRQPRSRSPPPPTHHSHREPQLLPVSHNKTTAYVSTASKAAAKGWGDLTSTSSSSQHQQQTVASNFMSHGARVSRFGLSAVAQKKLDSERAARSGHREREQLLHEREREQRKVLRDQQKVFLKAQQKAQRAQGLDVNATSGELQSVHGTGYVAIDLCADEGPAESLVGLSSEDEEEQVFSEESDTTSSSESELSSDDEVAAVVGDSPTVFYFAETDLVAAPSPCAVCTSPYVVSPATLKEAGTKASSLWMIRCTGAYCGSGPGGGLSVHACCYGVPRRYYAHSVFVGGAPAGMEAGGGGWKCDLCVKMTQHALLSQLRASSVEAMAHQPEILSPLCEKNVSTTMHTMLTSLSHKPMCAICRQHVPGAAFKFFDCVNAMSAGVSPWCHVSCAVWSPFVSIRNIRKMTIAEVSPTAVQQLLTLADVPVPATSHPAPLSSSHADRHTCVVCGSSTGLCIRCKYTTPGSQEPCPNFFHAACAIHALPLPITQLEAAAGLGPLSSDNSHNSAGDYDMRVVVGFHPDDTSIMFWEKVEGYCLQHSSPDFRVYRRWTENLLPLLKDKPQTKKTPPLLERPKSLSRQERFQRDAVSLAVLRNLEALLLAGQGSDSCGGTWPQEVLPATKPREKQAEHPVLVGEEGVPPATISGTYSRCQVGTLVWCSLRQAVQMQAAPQDPEVSASSVVQRGVEVLSQLKRLLTEKKEEVGSGGDNVITDGLSSQLALSLVYRVQAQVAALGPGGVPDARDCVGHGKHAALGVVSQALAAVCDNVSCSSHLQHQQQSVLVVDADRCVSTTTTTRQPRRKGASHHHQHTPGLVTLCLYCHSDITSTALASGGCPYALGDEVTTTTFTSGGDDTHGERPCTVTASSFAGGGPQQLATTSSRNKNGTVRKQRSKDPCYFDPGALSLQECREQCVLRALQFVSSLATRSKRNEESFIEFSGDMIFLFRNIIYRAQPGSDIAVQARALVAKMLNLWESLGCSVLEQYAESEQLMCFVEGLHAMQQMQWMGAAAMARARHSVTVCLRLYALEDLIRIDPSSLKTVPLTNAGYCVPCGQFHKLSLELCPECDSELGQQVDYEAVCEAVVWTSIFEELNIPLAASDGVCVMTDTLKFVRTLRPYQALATLGRDSFQGQCYFVTHLLFVLSGWGRIRLDAVLLAEEFIFCLNNLSVVIKLKDPELVGEFVQSLWILGLPTTHPSMLAAMAYLLATEQIKKRGSWMSSSQSYFKKYHAAYTGVVGLCDFFQCDRSERMNPSWEQFFCY